MRFCSKNMNRTTGIFTDSSERNSESSLCRLCRKNHDYYYNIFTSIVACKITVKDALHDFIGLQVSGKLYFIEYSLQRCYFIPYFPRKFRILVTHCLFIAISGC